MDVQTAMRSLYLGINLASALAAAIAAFHWYESALLATQPGRDAEARIHNQKAAIGATFAAAAQAMVALGAVIENLRSL